ncbi:hypothetical protein IMZ48_16970 [Candidatus Bathyarchaeota archaeon]|nr:hypothetical protein [Candidatus Bathyarchaeota archaeon]
MAKQLTHKSKGTSSELEGIILANKPVEASFQGGLQFEFKRRVKLTMKRKEIRSLLKDIRSCNERLDQFIAKAEKLEQPSSQPAGLKSTLALSLQEIQDYATSLHHALSRAWSCSALAPHRVYLLLEHRMVRKKRQKCLSPVGNPTDNANFTISLRSPSSTSHRHTIEFKIMEDIQPRGRLVCYCS